MNNNNNNNNDMTSTEVALSHIRGAPNTKFEQAMSFSTSSSSPAPRLHQPSSQVDYQQQLRDAENHVREVIQGSIRAGRPTPPASSSSTFPSLDKSPMRDEMYSDDHSMTLKELAMLRVEREMKG